MPQKPSVFYYDFEHFRSFLASRTQELAEQNPGLERFASFRELYYALSYEALEQQATLVAQLDPLAVYLFLPTPVSTQDYETAAKQTLKLLNLQSPPLRLELSPETLDSPLARWMRSEFVEDVLLPQRIEIQLVLNAQSLFDKLLRPQLEQRGFRLLDSYEISARSSKLRVSHPSLPRRTFQIPWVSWCHEMFIGGFNTFYFLTRFGAYLQRMQQAVEQNQPE